VGQFRRFAEGDVIEGNWLAVKRTDHRAFGLYREHYSAKKNLPYRRAGNTNVTGSGETMTLLSQDGAALFVWIHNTVERMDKQEGPNCAVFRNDGRGAARVLSSELIREATALAWGRWPGMRLWTYVDPAEVRSVQVMDKEPGQCFLAAGWRKCGVSAEGKVILEILPVEQEPA
jgi:hypothetical protein